MTTQLEERIQADLDIRAFFKKLGLTVNEIRSMHSWREENSHDGQSG